MRYLAFVSYSHGDGRWAHWLHRAIETYRLPRRISRERAIPSRPGRLFLDRSELGSSPDLSAAIQEALGEAENLILICSPAAAASRWVNEEVRRFRRMRGRERIFCLIVAGDPALRDGVGGCFPPALLAPEPGDEHPVEPLAADVRAGRDGRGNARLKLIAGILGLEFDSLRQRDQARRIRALAALATTLSVVAAALLVLSVVAVLARNEARRQAETSTRTTNFLRTLFAPADPADGLGRDPTVRAMVDRGAAQIATTPELREQPLVRADLMTTLAEAYVALGQYRAADALVRRAARADRSDAQVAVRQDSIRAQIAGAGERFAEAKAFIDRALATAPPEPSAARSLMLVDRAFAERGLGEQDAADRTLVQARLESLSLRPPDLEGADRALKELAAGHFLRGQYDRAESEFAVLLRSRRRLGRLDDDPLVGVAYNQLGAIRYKRGDNATAGRWFARALAIESRLLGNDNPKVATIRGNLARILVEQRRFAPALALLAQARAAVVRENGPGQAVLAAQDDSVGLAHAGLGDAAAAEAAFRRGLAVASATGSPKQGDLLVDLAALLCGTARARAAMPLLDAADRAYAGAPATPAWMKTRAAQVRGQCLFAAGARDTGAALIRGNAPAAIAHWGRDSLFGADAAAALASVGKVPARSEPLPRP